MTTSTELVRQANAEIDLRTNPTLSLDDLQNLLHDLPPQTPPVSAPPKTTVTVTQELTDAIALLPQVLCSVAPASWRPLNGAERARLAAEKRTIDQVKSTLEKRIKEIADLVHMDADATAKQAGIVNEDTPRDDKGHYVIARPQAPETLPGDDLSEWSREYRPGKRIPAHDRAKKHLTDGVITRADYMAVTVQERRVDLAKIDALINCADEATKARGLRLQALLVDDTPPTTSINLRPKK